MTQPAAAAPVTLLVVDDHTLFRRGLIALLGQDAGLHVVGEAGDAAEALRLVPTLQPDVILLDNHLPGVMGVDAIRGLREVSPRSRVLMLTVSEDSQDLAAALRNGAQGYLLKTIDGDLLAQAIRRAAQGEPVVSPELMGVLAAGGVNRVSVGAQSFNPRHLKTLERWHDPENVARALELARKAGIGRQSLDLIFGIPGQSLSEWGAELRRAVDLGTSHVSCYNLTYEPNTAMTARRNRG